MEHGSSETSPLFNEITLVDIDMNMMHVNPTVSSKAKQDSPIEHGSSFFDENTLVDINMNTMHKKK